MKPKKNGWCKKVKGLPRHAQYLMMCETKARKDMDALDVKAKAEAGALWCKHASVHARTHDAKPWNTSWCRMIR